MSLPSRSKLNLNTMLRQHTVHLEKRRLWFNPKIFLMGTAEPVSSSTEHKSFDWAGPACLAESLVLASQVAFAKCVSLMSEGPTTHCSQHSLQQSFASFNLPRGWGMKWDVIPPQSQVSMRLFQKLISLSELFLRCHSSLKFFFSRPSIVLQVVHRAQVMFPAMQWLFSPL